MIEIPSMTLLQAVLAQSEKVAMQVEGDTDKVPQGEGSSAAKFLRPLKITVAPNGARRQKKDHRALPISLVEIAMTAKACHAAGADEVHLHVREPSGQHSLSVNLYEQALAAIDVVAPDMTVQVTTESAGLFSVEDQFDLLRELIPAAASISVREVLRKPEIAPQLYKFCAKEAIDVQHILYDRNDLEALRDLLDRGVVPPQMRKVILVFGRYAPAQNADPADVAPFVADLGDDFPDWTVCAFGPTELSVAEEAIKLGGHVRIGFENNLTHPDGTPLTSNADSVAAVVELARRLKRPLLKEQKS